MNDGPSGLRTWMQLRTIGNSPAVRASVLFPIIGYLILFNEQVEAFLNMSKFENVAPATGVLAWIWTRKLYFIYFGLMSLGIGSVIYAVRCPFILKKHGDFADYVRIDGPSISQYALLEYAQSLGFPTEIHSVEERKSDALHQWYARQSVRHRISRDAVAILFGIGLLLVSVPSFVSAVKISSLFLFAEMAG